jgi:hypothetical protein
MPAPSVEPIPRVFRDDFLSVPLDAQDASYFAASARIASFSIVLCIVRSLFKMQAMASVAAQTS